MYTQEWELCEKGKEYNRKVNLYTTADTNERMYVGDQWRGVVSNGLPTPVFNIFKRVIDYFIAAVMSQKTKMQFVPENIAEDTQDPNEIQVKEAADIISSYSETLWETLKMDMNLRQALLDSALSGDACAYMLWNPNEETGQELEAGVKIMGGIEIELPDNVNVFFGNPNDKRVQKQPYIIISFRELVTNLRKEAKEYDVSQQDIAKIVSDTDNKEQSGDMSKIELDNINDTSGKVTTIIKLWRNSDTGRIMFNKSTKSVQIRKDVETKLKLYPVAWKNWTSRKNSYHGQAVGTGLVPNQIFINKMFAMVMMNLMYTAFPKAVYNKDIISNWSNTIGQAIGVSGGDNMNNVATFLRPGEMSAQVMNVIEAAIQHTKELVGATDAGLGDVKPDNTSAIIAVQQAASIPLESIKSNLYQWVEDIGYIWLDFMANYYGKRKIPITVNGQRQIVEFDFNQLQNMRLKLKVDVGPSSYWSEITAMQTLDNLLTNNRITFLQYLDRIPNGLIPQKQELIEELQAQMQQQQQMMAQQQAQMGKEQVLSQLSPEEQQNFMMMSPEEQQAMLEQAMGGQQPMQQPQMMGGGM